MKVTMITRRRFIRNGALAVGSLSAQQATAADAIVSERLASRVLVVYNTAADDGTAVANYYRMNRPGMSGVDTLAVRADTTETTTFANVISQVRTPIYEFVAGSPFPKYYVIMCRGLPSRVWENGSAVASVDYLIARCDPNLVKPVEAEYQQGDGANYYNGSFVPDLFPGTSFLVTRMDMGSLSATEAYIRKIKTVHDAMRFPGIIISASSAGLGGSNYLLDEVRNPGYHSLFPIQTDYSDLGTYANVPSARRKYISGITNTDAHLTSGADILGYESWGTNGGMSSAYPNDQSLIFTGNSNWYLVKTFESWNGIIGSTQGNFDKWFHPSTAGGWKYSRTPIGMVCHTDEPTVGGVEGSMYMCNWEAGLLFSECAWSSRNTKYFMAVGDPLVRR